MEHGTESFWTDIKRYEDILAKDPASYCFAPLSELYRKVGLLDDAIMTARTGITQHPEYVGGYMALGRACFEKGERTESRTALEKVVRVTPDNLMAQKLLGQIYIDAGETDLGRRCLEIILSLSPDDLESKLMLEAITLRPRENFGRDEELFGGADVSPDMADDDESLLEEIEIIEDLVDEVVDEEEVPAFVEESSPYPVAEESFADVLYDEETPEAAGTDKAAADGDASDRRDVLSTGTIADLYIAQGFPKKALAIYRDLLEADPLNEEIRNRMVDLKRRIDEDEARARERVLADDLPIADSPAGIGELVDDSAVAFEGDERGAAFGFSDEVAPRADFQVETVVSPEPSIIAAEGDASPSPVVSVLEGWLDSIRRIRQCRSGIH